MKLPFNVILAPILRPYLGSIRTFCQHPTFAFSFGYTCLYAILGLVICSIHLRSHLGKNLPSEEDLSKQESQWRDGIMLLHDLKIIATSMGLVQYSCLLVGCLTENPALFLPHLISQLLIISVKILNVCYIIAHMNWKSIRKIHLKIPNIAMMTFNWLQEFCVFRQILCVCDL